MNTDGTGTGLNLNSKVSFDQATSKLCCILHIHTDCIYIQTGHIFCLVKALLLFYILIMNWCYNPRVVH